MTSCRSCQYVIVPHNPSESYYYKCECPKLGSDPITGEVRQVYCIEIRKGATKELPQSEQKCSGYIKRPTLKGPLNKFISYFKSTLSQSLK